MAEIKKEFWFVCAAQGCEQSKMVTPKRMNRTSLEEVLVLARAHILESERDDPRGEGLRLWDCRQVLVKQSGVTVGIVFQVRMGPFDPEFVQKVGTPL